MSILTIVTPSPTVDLTTLATVKDELGVTAGTPSDATLGRWIHEVSMQISNICHRTFGRETVSELFTEYEASVGPLKLRRFPVAQVDSVTEGGVLLTTDEWLADLEAGIVRRRTWGLVNTHWLPCDVTVVYQAGYQLLGELPYDIERAALLLMRYRHQAGNRDPMVRSEAIPGKYEISYWVGSVPGSGDASLPPDVMELLKPHIEQIV